MTWFSRMFSGQQAPGQALTARQQQLIAGWQQLPEADLRRSHYRCRYVVVDVEATGTDVTSDRLRAIAAQALVDGQIDFKDAFQLVLADVERGVAGQSVEALIAFLQFVGKAPLVAYNAPFVARMIDNALAEHLGIKLGLPWIDLAWVLPDLFRDADDAQGGLDGWLAHFGVDSIDRHNALSDAFATAQLLQITIAHAARKGFDTPASLHALEKARRHLHQSG
jgi:DNA polymerase-3 subunit epsilon